MVCGYPTALFPAGQSGMYKTIADAANVMSILCEVKICPCHQQDSQKSHFYSFLD